MLNDDLPIVVEPMAGYMRDHAVRNAFNRAFKKAELPWTATRILRHTFATWNLMASGSDISAVQVAMGHKRRTTTEIYAKPLAAMTGEVVDKGADMMMNSDHVQEKTKGEKSSRTNNLMRKNGE